MSVGRSAQLAWSGWAVKYARNSQVASRSRAVNAPRPVQVRTNRTELPPFGSKEQQRATAAYPLLFVVSAFVWVVRGQLFQCVRKRFVVKGLIS